MLFYVILCYFVLFYGDDFHFPALDNDHGMRYNICNQKKMKETRRGHSRRGVLACNKIKKEAIGAVLSLKMPDRKEK